MEQTHQKIGWRNFGTFMLLLLLLLHLQPPPVQRPRAQQDRKLGKETAEPIHVMGRSRSREARLPCAETARLVPTSVSIYPLSVCVCV